MRHISIVVAVIGCSVHSAFAGRTSAVVLSSLEPQKKKDNGLASDVFAVLPITARGYRDQ